MPLVPTPTRLALLRDVAAGGVCRYGDGRDYDSSQRLRGLAVALMEHAGWVVLGPAHPVKTPWLLTDAGRAVLAKGAP